MGDNAFKGRVFTRTFTLRKRPNTSCIPKGSERLCTQTNKQACKESNGRPDKQTNKQTDRQTNKQPNKQTNNQTSKQASKQTHNDAYIHESILSLRKLVDCFGLVTHIFFAVTHSLDNFCLGQSAQETPSGMKGCRATKFAERTSCSPGWWPSNGLLGREP